MGECGCTWMGDLVRGVHVGVISLPTYQLFSRNQMTSKGKTGMKELMDIVLGLKQDVKRMNSLISPQGAQSLVEKNNNSNPNSKWALKRLEVNGPAVLNNMPDINNDGVPDVIIVDKNGNPVYSNGYTTVKKNYYVIDIKLKCNAQEGIE